jgi:hypothetical protein
MVINHLSVLASDFGVGFSLVHTMSVVVSDCGFRIIQDVSWSAVNDHGCLLCGRTQAFARWLGGEDVFPLPSDGGEGDA